MLIRATKDTPQLRQKFRQKRNRLLQATDSLLLPDRNFTEEQINQTYLYRQALRDSTSDTVTADKWTLPVPPPFLQQTDPFNLTFDDL